jgi:hypothetical protein
MFYHGSAALDYGLYLLHTKLEKLEHSLSEYGIPLYKYDWAEALNRASARRVLSSNPLIVEQLSYDVRNEKSSYEIKYGLLNADQRNAFDTIISRIETPTPIDPSSSSHDGSICFFLHGPGGTGKTFVYNTICHYLRSQEKIVLCVASSGIASLLLPGGRTSHFRLKIPIKINESSFRHIPKDANLAELLRQTSLIIWDEFPIQICSLNLLSGINYIELNKIRRGV